MPNETCQAFTNQAFTNQVVTCQIFQRTYGGRARLLAGSAAVLLLASGFVTSAVAADLAAAPPAPVAPDWTSSITHTLQLEGGIAVNPNNPVDHKNLGQLFSDEANQPLFNQALLTVARPVDSTVKGYDYGFNIQALFGSDARYLPTLGILDYTLKGRYQAVFTQGNFAVHTPWLSDGGIDFKAGLYPGLMGYETTDPSTRPFYTFSYVSNFLLPFEHVGVQGVWHVNSTLDIWADVDTGNEVTFGTKDNNSKPAGYFGFGLNNILDGKLTVLAMTRLGPEDPVRAFGQVANNYMRYWNDVTATYKASDAWTFVGEANYFLDEGLNAGAKADAYGFVGYASYKLTDEVQLNLRGEIFRDNTGAITVNYLTNTAFADSLLGTSTAPEFSGPFVPVTIGDITAGLTYKPTFINDALKVAKVTIRPEVRYDGSLNNTKPFNTQTTSGQFLFSTDVIVAF